MGQEDPLEKGKATHSSILAWRIPWTVHGVAKSWTQLSNFHFLEGINSRISEAEERINELEDKMVEITSEEQHKVKRMKRTENHLRNLWNNIKRTNIQIIGVPEEEKRKGYEKIFEEIIVENSPNMERLIKSERCKESHTQQMQGETCQDTY